MPILKDVVTKTQTLPKQVDDMHISFEINNYSH